MNRESGQILVRLHSLLVIIDTFFKLILQFYHKLSSLHIRAIRVLAYSMLAFRFWSEGRGLQFQYQLANLVITVVDHALQYRSLLSSLLNVALHRPWAYGIGQN